MHGEVKHSGDNFPHNQEMQNRGAARPSMQQSSASIMDKEERQRMAMTHHTQTLWIYWLLVILGLWMTLSPLTFAYDISFTQPAGGRTLWLTNNQRILYSKWSDIVSGLLLLFFGFRSLTMNRPISRWICCFIGVWLNIAPILFWAPAAAIYINDTSIGMLVISLSVLIPGMPNMIMYMKMGSEVPRGWTYNPSSWDQRWIMIVTGMLGFFVSRYLAAYQLGYLHHSWEPFFTSSEQVLNSSMSRALPVSDAGLGSLAYTFEFLMGFMGSSSRWRTMPWMVTFFGILVIPLGLVHIFLVISQPLVVGAWCTFCLLAAAIMLPMIPLEADEVIAMGQHIGQARRNGEKFWDVFWKGGKPVEKNKDERSPEIAMLPQNFKNVLASSLWGMSAPVTLVIATLIGLVFMILPDQMHLPTRSSIANLNHLCGALVIVIAVISMGEVIRPLRLVNIVVGGGLAVVPWFLANANSQLKMFDIVGGILVVACSLPRGIKKEKYGSWDKYIV